MELGALTEMFDWFGIRSDFVVKLPTDLPVKLLEIILPTHLKSVLCNNGQIETCVNI